MTKTNLTSLDTDALYLAGTLVSASAAELNNVLDKSAVQALTGDGEITQKNGVATLNKGAAIAATIVQPTATTDDFKRLKIISLTAQAHTVTIPATGWGGNVALTVATCSGAIGDCIDLIAYQGIWYVTNVHQVTFA